MVACLPPSLNRPMQSPGIVSAGDHTLRVTAADEAGNTAEDQVVFTVE